MSAEQYRNGLDQLHASPELKARLAALQRETPPAAKPSKLRLAKRCGGVCCGGRRLPDAVCGGVARRNAVGQGGFSAAAEHSTQMDEAMVKPRHRKAERRPRPPRTRKRLRRTVPPMPPARNKKTEVANPSAASGAEAITLPQTATLRASTASCIVTPGGSPTHCAAE